MTELSDEELREKIEKCVDELDQGHVVRMDWMTVTEFMQMLQEKANEKRQGKQAKEEETYS